ncbi:hypothetical protein LIA77_11796 [Sarocladium implicatum]|nr:hypothetical protein LIA77_11796 [Sarocladium implicatum]
MAFDFWLGRLGDHVTPNSKDVVDPIPPSCGIRCRVESPRAQYRNGSSSKDGVMAIEELMKPSESTLAYEILKEIGTELRVR